MSSELPPGQNTSRTQRIVTFAGPIRSGKNAACNFVGGLLLVSSNRIDEFRMRPDGEMEVGGKLVNINDIDPSYLKVFAFGDLLKEVCSKIFNIPLELFYSRDGKNELTHLYWETMPGVNTNEVGFNAIKKILEKKQELTPHVFCDVNIGLYHPPGRMTVREVMQFFGTDICRKMYGPCWVAALTNKILADNPVVALISDARFDDEIQQMYEAGSYLVKLLRNKEASSHSSENGLTWDKWDAVIDNRNMDFRQFNEALYNHLKPLGVFNPV